MADTIFTRTLAQGAQVQGSHQALAYLLRVPENTLLRWMSGRAQMPLAAFHRLIGLLVEHEQLAASEPQPQPVATMEKFDFSIGTVLARCARCGGTQFAPAMPGPALKMSSLLRCCSCTFSVKHAELLTGLAAEAVRHSRAMASARKRPAKARVIRLAAR